MSLIPWFDCKGDGTCGLNEVFSPIFAVDGGTFEPIFAEDPDNPAINRCSPCPVDPSEVPVPTVDITEFIKDETGDIWARFAIGNQPEVGDVIDGKTVVAVGTFASIGGSWDSLSSLTDAEKVASMYGYGEDFGPFGTPCDPTGNLQNLTGCEEINHTTTPDPCWPRRDGGIVARRYTGADGRLTYNHYLDPGYFYGEDAHAFAVWYSVVTYYQVFFDDDTNAVSEYAYDIAYTTPCSDSFSTTTDLSYASRTLDVIDYVTHYLNTLLPAFWNALNPVVEFNLSYTGEFSGPSIGSINLALAFLGNTPSPSFTFTDPTVTVMAEGTPYYFEYPIWRWFQYRYSFRLKATATLILYGAVGSPYADKIAIGSAGPSVLLYRQERSRYDTESSCVEDPDLPAWTEPTETPFTSTLELDDTDDMDLYGASCDSQTVGPAASSDSWSQNVSIGGPCYFTTDPPADYVQAPGSVSLNNVELSW